MIKPFQRMQLLRPFLVAVYSLVYFFIDLYLNLRDYPSGAF